MNDTPHRWDVWVQWLAIVLTILGGIWQLGGRLSRIEQRLEDSVVQQAEQGKSIERLQEQIIGLTRRIR